MIHVEKQQPERLPQMFLLGKTCLEARFGVPPIADLGQRVEPRDLFERFDLCERGDLDGIIAENFDAADHFALLVADRRDARGNRYLIAIVVAQE